VEGLQVPSELPPHVGVPVMERTRLLRASGKGARGQRFQRYTVEELANLVGVDPDTLRGWARYWEPVSVSESDVREAWVTWWRTPGRSGTFLDYLWNEDIATKYSQHPKSMLLPAVLTVLREVAGWLLNEINTATDKRYIQAEVARTLGVVPSTVSKWVHGTPGRRHPPTQEGVHDDGGGEKPPRLDFDDDVEDDDDIDDDIDIDVDDGEEEPPRPDVGVDETHASDTHVYKPAVKESDVDEMELDDPGLPKWA